MRRGAIVAIAVFGCLQLTKVAAQGEVYVAPPECPSEQEFRELLVGKLGHDPMAAPGSDYSVQITAGETTDTTTYSASLLVSGQVARQIDDTDCDSAANALASSLAISLQDLSGKPEEPKEMKPTVSIVPEVPKKPNTAQDDIVPPSTTLQLSVFLRGETTGFLFPNASLGFAAGTALRRGLLRAGIGFIFQSQIGLFESAFVQTTSQLMGGEVFGCATGDSLRVCLPVNIARYDAKQPASATSSVTTIAADLFVSIGLRVAYQFAIGRFHLGAHVGLNIPLTPVTIANGTSRVWNAPPVFVSGGLNVDFDLL